MLRYFFLIFGFLVVMMIAIVGWRGQKTSRPPIEIFPDMDRQPKVKAQVPSEFYADGRAARLPVPGTVPLGYEMPTGNAASEARDKSPYDRIEFSTGTDYENTGQIGDHWGTGFPSEMTMMVMERGQERFRIFCAVCHGATGAGNGMAQKFGVNTVQSLLQDRIRIMADGEIFNTITHGKNTMLGYGDRIPVPDRWAIIAYLRALQRSQGGATLADVPEAEQAKLQKPPTK
jgi:Cytochrome C oxidase, cbb3-type, subunit III